MAGTTLQFPEGFLWGTATSAHQVEGNNKNSDWWEFEQHGGLKDHEISGVAVDHYNRFEEDFDIAESLFQNAHRFSVEWSRIEIQEGVFDIIAMNHYKDVFQALKKRGMKVMVTLFHFTLPLWLAKKGGWENSNSVKYFSRFAEYVARQIGDDVDFWITLDAPLNYARASYLHGQFPPCVKNRFRFFKVFNRLSSAHEEAYFAIHKALKGACIGISMNIPFSMPHSSKLIDKIVVWGAKQIAYKRFLSHVKTSLDFIGLQPVEELTAGVEAVFGGG